MSNPSSPRAANTPTDRAILWLRTRPPRQWLLAALLPVLVGAWLPLLRGRSDGPSPAPMPQASSTTTPITAPANAGTFANPTPSLAPSPSSPLAAAPLGEIATPFGALAMQPFEQRLQVLSRAYQPRWSADADPAPFRSTLRAEVQSADTPAIGTSWTPTAIVLSPSVPAIAIVQGAPRHVGDRIGERTLIAIEEHRVVYREGDVTIPIALPTPQLGGRP